MKNTLSTLLCEAYVHITDLIKKLLSAPQDVLELGELQEVLLQRLLVGVYFLQLILELLERGLCGGIQDGSAEAGRRSSR